MPSPIPQAAISTIAETVGVMESARVLIDNIDEMLVEAVEGSLALGATEAQLAPVQAALDELTAKKQVLADAVAANS